MEIKADLTGQLEHTSQLAEAVAEAEGRPELDLALVGRAGGNVGRSLWATVFHMGGDGGGALGHATVDLLAPLGGRALGWLEEAREELGRRSPGAVAAVCTSKVSK